MIYKFYDFIFENYLKLDTYLYYSINLKNILNYLDVEKSDKVSKILINSEHNDEFKSDITFIDLGMDDDKISFIQLNRVLRIIDKDLGDPESKNQGKVEGQFPIDYIDKIWHMAKDQDSNVWKEQRTEVSVGKFVKKIFQKSTNNKAKSTTQNDINKFVDNFRSYRVFQKSKKDKFEIVKGEDIRKWYDENNYENPMYTLNNSCMRYKRCKDYLNIYTENTNQVNMVIMKGTDPDKIIGRALIWKLNNGEIYLDRPYANSDNDINLFKEWASSRGFIIYGNDYKHKQVTLEKSEFEYYPYMDTFKYLNRNEKLLSTDSNEYDDRNPDWIRLERTDGGYEHPPRGVYSEYYDEYIDEDDAVYAEDLQSYIRQDDAIWLEYKEQYVSDQCEVVFSNFYSQYYLEEDVVRSEYLNDYIHENDAIEVYYDSVNTTWVPDDFMIKGIADEYLIEGEWKTCISSCVFMSPFAKEYFFRDGTVLVYKLKDGTLVTPQEAEEKEIDVKDLNDSFYVELEEYMSRIKKINNEEELYSKLLEYDFTNYISRFNDLVKKRVGFSSDLKTLLSTEDETLEMIIKIIILFSYNASEKNQYGIPKFRNRKGLLRNNESIDKKILGIFDILTSSTLEKIFDTIDSQMGEIVSDKEFLYQIIEFKSSR